MYVVNHWVKSFIGDEEETTTHDLTEDTTPAVAEGAQEKQLPTTTPTAVKPTSVPGIAAIQPSPASLRPPTPTASESEPMDIVPDEGIASGKLMSDRFNLNACMHVFDSCRKNSCYTTPFSGDEEESIFCEVFSH